MAGVGKSTISRTVARNFSKQGLLGASFFFKRGEGDRGRTSKLITTLVIQVVRRIPALSAVIQALVQAEPSIAEKALKEQFERLLLMPLLELQHDAPVGTLILIIDALDECDDDRHANVILHLFAQLHQVKLIKLRVLITSRPELAIRLGFKELSRGVYENLVLHEVPRPDIEHDIKVYLESGLHQIREKRNHLAPPQGALAAQWPSQGQLERLVELAVPLFIVAVTACRFIADIRWDA